jgi:hypothetical protein
MPFILAILVVVVLLIFAALETLILDRIRPAPHTRKHGYGILRQRS